MLNKHAYLVSITICTAMAETVGFGRGAACLGDAPKEA